MTQPAGACAAGEEAVPTKKTKTVVSASEIRTSKARVQKVKKVFSAGLVPLPQGLGEGHQHGHLLLDSSSSVSPVLICFCQI